MERFVAALEALGLPRASVLVAVSGGVDSVVLLDLLHETRDGHGLDLVVAHVDHGIRPDSGAVARHVENLARQFGLPFELVSLGLGPDASETRARTARYRALREIARRHGARYILTAHHLDDQRETVLMRFLNGSGPSGLAGMRRKTRDLARPLLSFSRRSLVAYARARGLEWAEDPSNLDPRHLRSWIRHEVMPRMKERLSSLERNLDRTRRQAGIQRRALHQLLRHWPELGYRDEAGRGSLSMVVLERFPTALQVTLVQTLLRAVGGPAGVTRLRRALRALAGGQSGLTADLGGQWRLERSFERLVVVPPPAGDEPAALLISGPAGSTTWDGWRITWQEGTAPATQPRVGDTAWFAPASLVVRPPKAGDRLVPLGGVGRRLAVRCFQDAQVARSERARWPVIESGGTVTWIPGVCRSARLCPAAGEPAIRVEVKRVS
ncbi:MAG: tRNA lysidine(34) synthetase TilS [Gemmatimonadota bacterium]|nr:tRNA lysidine(34) synthetase TilS [Gemmatimonadota bacterium]